MKKIVFTAAALTMGGMLTFAATSPALAETRSVAVPTAGYDSASEAGYAMLARRIDRAAEDVCGWGSRDLGIAAAQAECRDVAREDGMAQLDARRARVTVGD